MKTTTNTSIRRKLAALFCLPSAAALAAAGGLAIILVNGPMALPAYAEPVNDCLDVVTGNDGVARLFNSCPFTVEAVWCVEGVDCNGGRFTNMSTIHSMRGNIVHGGAGRTVRWGACRGANSISHYGTAAYSYEFTCTD